MRCCLLVLILLAPAAIADAETGLRSNTVSLDPLMGALGFSGRNLGEWAVSYERRVRPRHAVLLEQTTVHVHEDPFHLTMLGVGVGYRHILRAEAASSPFAGLVAGAKLGTGRFGDMPDSSLSARAVFATAHAGWRWTSRRGLTITVRIGAGWAHYMLADDAPPAAVAMQDDRLAPLPFELDTETSIGWSF